MPKQDGADKAAEDSGKIAGKRFNEQFFSSPKMEPQIKKTIKKDSESLIHSSSRKRISHIVRESDGW